MKTSDPAADLDPDDRRAVEAVGRSLSSDDGGAADCAVINRRLHRGSVNLELRVSVGDDERDVFVKRLREASTRRFDAFRAEGDRPRLKPVPDPETKLRHEADALDAVGAMVRGEGTDELFAVGVVADLPGVLVLERHDCPTFAELASQGGNDEQLRLASHRAGRWLHAFHGLPDLPHTHLHLSTRDDVGALVLDLLDHVDHAGWDGAQVRQRVEAMVAELPSTLPLALGHGDFAAHNVFVDPEGRVAVFDTSADLRMPPHVDLAYFSVLLEFADLRRVVPKAEARLATESWREGLRAGYGVGVPPLHEVRLFEIVVLLEKWSSLLAADRGSRLRRTAKRIRRALLVRRLQSAVEDRLAEAS